MQSFHNTKDLKDYLDKRNQADVLLDVRTPEEFKAGHIKGALNFNISTLNVFNNIQKLDKEKTYILYCRSGSRSQMAAMIMAQKGLNVINCRFGFMHLNGTDLETV